MADDKRAISQAKAQMDSISDLMMRYRAAHEDDTYEMMAQQIAETAGFEVIEGDNGFVYRKNGTTPDAEPETYDTEEAAWFACCEDNDLRPDADDVQQEINEDPLSIEIRSGWVTPGGEMDPEEFCILLCTGGPAVRIVGDLNAYAEPDRARMEYQDWGLPWTEYFDTDHDALLDYARQFSYGVG